MNQNFNGFNCFKSFQHLNCVSDYSTIQNIEKQLSKCVYNADIIETLAEKQREIMKVVCDFLIYANSLYI